MKVHDVRPYHEIELTADTINSLTISIERLLSLLKNEFNEHDRLFMNIEISFQDLRYANSNLYAIQCSLKTLGTSYLLASKGIVPTVFVCLSQLHCIEYFFYNCHIVKSSVLNCQLSFRSLLRGRQTSK